MADWDDSDGEDAWDVDSDDDILEARLNKLNTGDSSQQQQQPPEFDDEEDLAVKEKEMNAKKKTVELKTKGNALAEKKKAELERKEEEEVARKAMELESEYEANMTADERRQLEKRRLEEADNDLLDDFLGASGKKTVGGTSDRTRKAGDDLVLNDLKDHLKHARVVGKCITKHKKVHLATAFLKEAIQESKDVLDDNAITDIIKICNVIKNEKVAAAKKKTKGQAQKSKKNKAAETKARQLQEELYGDNNEYDEYDDMGDDFEDDYF